MRVYRILLLLMFVAGAALSASAQTRQANPVAPAPVATAQAKMARAMIDLPAVDWTDEAAKEAGAEDFRTIEGIIKVRPHPNSHGYLLLYEVEKITPAAIVSAMEEKGYQVDLLAAPKRSE